MQNTWNADSGQAYLKIRKNEADPKICTSRSTQNGVKFKKKTSRKNIQN